MRTLVFLLVAIIGTAPVRAQEVVTRQIDDHVVEGVIHGREGPVVVIEAGLGEHGADWRSIQSELAAGATVLTYSRAGYGHSGPTTVPRTPPHIARELRAFVDSLGLEPPFILVGHSLGGMTMRVFAAQYPDLVAGLVLVDGAHERQYVEWSSLHSTFWVDTWASLSEYADSLGSHVYAEVQGLWGVFRKGVLPEAWPLPNIPMIVLTQVLVDDSWTGATAEGVEIWRNLHTEYFRQSTNARHIVVNHVGHNIRRDDPALVVDVIRQMIEMVDQQRE